ncbi:MAG: inositol-3-phosphate synthase, partial [Candidatus Methylomirabilia bacterium]
IARDRGIGGVLEAPSAYFMKTPPRQYPDSAAFAMVERFALPGADKAAPAGAKKAPAAKKAGTKAGK